MAITIPHSFTNGTIAEASEVNANTNAIANYVNGLYDGTNIDSSAITAAKLAINAVTTTKIADGSITEAKFETNLLQSDSVIIAGQVFG
jgi:hypothetical protein